MGGSLTETEIEQIRNSHARYRGIQNFVETGTYDGDTAILASRLFNTVYTVEVFPTLHNGAKQRANLLGITNINFLLGDSTKHLSELSTLVKTGAIYFLDGHYSGDGTGWNGDKYVPLYEELDAVLSTPNLGPTVFIIDDVRLWTTQADPYWSHITTTGILEEFKKHNYTILSYFIKNDRLVIFI